MTMKLINARGTFTPLGVSRSSPGVAAAVAAALLDFVVMDELQAEAGRRIARWSGAEAGTVTHCAAAAITLAVAAAMVGSNAARIAALPDISGVPHRVVLPVGHAVNYGHPIEQAIRLAGATPVLAEDIPAALAQPDTAALLLVSSRLTCGRPVDLASAVAAAHARGVPAILDGAAQDWRIPELLATGADLVLVSAQKYLAAPTAGLVMGRGELVAAVRAQEKGIGRAMKASKEAIAGVLAAIAERETVDPAAWTAEQDCKLARFLASAKSLPDIVADAEPDPTGLPFARARLRMEPTRALALAKALRAGKPSIWVIDQAAEAGDVVFELVPLDDDEIDAILARLRLLASS
jgi:uncharacterized pyridoxal phosphate-dependent enzyme